MSNSGFTLVEMLFVVATIISIMLLTFPMMITETNNYDYVVATTKYAVDTAKYLAITNRDKVEIVLKDNKIVILDHDVEYILQGYEFSEDYNIHFTKNGNINMAKTVLLCKDSECINFVLQLESGKIYVR